MKTYLPIVLITFFLATTACVPEGTDPEVDDFAEAIASLVPESQTVSSQQIENEGTDSNENLEKADHNEVDVDDETEIVSSDGKESEQDLSDTDDTVPINGSDAEENSADLEKKDANNTTNIDLASTFNLGIEVFDAQDYATAITYFDDIIENSAENKQLTKAYVYRGVSKQAMNKHVSAIADFDQAIYLNPHDVFTYIDRATSKLAVNDVDGAEKDFLHILNQDIADKERSMAYYHLGTIDFDRGNYSRAVGYFDALIDLNPNEGEGYYLRGVSRELSGDFDGAYTDFTQLIKMGVNLHVAYGARGTVELNKLTHGGNQEIDPLDAVSACEDILKAQELGNQSVNELVTTYCS